MAPRSGLRSDRHPFLFLFCILASCHEGALDGRCNANPADPASSCGDTGQAASWIGDSEVTWPEFVAWLSSSGAFIHGSLRIKLIDGRIRGIVIDADLPQGTSILRIPRSMWIRSGEDSSGKQMLDEANIAECTALSDQRFAYWVDLLLEMRKGDTSFWAPWFRMLPPWEDLREYHPLLAGATVRADFSDLPIIQSLGTAWQESIDSMHRCLQAISGGPFANLTLQAIDMALYVSLARSHSDAHGNRVLVPGADFYNTAGQDEVNVEWSIDNYTLELKVSRNVQAGSELLMEYCSSCDNEAMLSTWGVYLESNPNRLFAIDPMNCSSSHREGTPSNAADGTLRGAALAMLDLHGIDAALDSGWVAPPCIDAAAASTEQVVLRCSLARLAWETCAKAWGFDGWRSPRDDLIGIEKRYEAMLQAAPMNAHIHKSFGQVLQRMGDFKGAEKKFLAAVRLQPWDADLHIRRADILARRGDVAAAEETYLGALRADPQNVLVLANLGTLCASRGDLVAAENHWRRALEFNPENVEVLSNLGTHLRDRGDLVGAEHYLYAALRLTPGDAEVHAGIGAILTRKKDSFGAEQSFETASRLDPGRVDMPYNIGVLQANRGEVEKAEKTWGAALKIDPANVVVHFSLSQLLVRKQDFAGAERSLRAVLHRDPYHVKAHVSLGSAFANQGNLLGAKQSWQTALQLEPQNANVHADYGMLLVSTGEDFDGAVQSFRTAIRINPQHEEAKANLGRVLMNGPEAFRGEVLVPFVQGPTFARF